MKKFLVLVSCCMMGLGASAQKTVTTTTTTAHTETSYQFTQARMPQVWVEPIVKPLVVEVEIIEGAPTRWKRELSKQKVEKELEGKIENIYNYGVFLYTEEPDVQADMIVAATYNFYTNPNHKNEEDMYILEIKGFPAKFIKWHTAKPDDYEWMKIRYNFKDSDKKEVFEKIVK